MSKHTPGPWTILPGDDFDGGLVVYCADVDQMPNPSYCAKTIAIGEGVDEGEGSWPEVQANAALVAAAPEMLEALKWARPIAELWLTTNSVPFANKDFSGLDAIDAAIAKAEGTQ